MRIGFGNVSQPPGRVTGITVYAWSLLGAMLRRTDDPIVLFTSWGKDDLPFRSDRLEVVTLPYIGSEYRRLWQDNVDLPRQLEQHKIDALLNVVPSAPLLGKTPTAIISHDLYAKVFPDSMSWKNRLLEDVVYKLSLRKAAAAIAVSENTRRDLLRFYPRHAGRVEVVQAAATLDAGSTAVAGAEQLAVGPYALFVANIAPTKNVEVLAQAASRLGSSPLKLVHVGRDPEGLLTKAIADHGVQDRFLSAGSVSDEALAQWYAGATCVVMPSLYEGFGLPALEAQARGVPLVSSTGGALPEVVSDSGLLFEPDDAEALAGHLLTLAGSAELRTDLVARGHRNLGRFSWEKSADAALEILRSIARS